MESLNSALHWLPRVETSGVPTPRTEIVDMFSCFDGIDGKECQPFDDLVGAVEKVAEEIGYPVFIRSDQTSAKHDFRGIKAVRADGPSDVAGCIAAILETHAMAFGFEAWQAILVREWLPTNHDFVAKGGQPIGREFRCFHYEKEGPEVFPYWSADALEPHIDRETPTDWRERLERHAEVDIETEAKLHALMRAVADAVNVDDPQDWSIDFLQHENGDWYCIDMALAADSFHPTRNNPYATEAT